MPEKVLFTGKTHTTGGADGAARSSDGSLDIRLPEPHPERNHTGCGSSGRPGAAGGGARNLPVFQSDHGNIEVTTNPL